MPYHPGMGFFQDARRGAGQKYGADRSEQWGWWARLWVKIQLAGVGALALGIVYIWSARG